MKWHAPHPSDPRRPLCGTVGEDGNPTHRVAKTVPVTCARCKKALEKVPLVEIAPDSRAGKEPCGECHLQPGERCDVCGARQSVNDH